MPRVALQKPPANSREIPGPQDLTIFSVSRGVALFDPRNIDVSTALAITFGSNYAVVHHLGNTISNSWSSVEALGNPAQFIRVNRILEMAAAQGIDVNFATGDFGDESPVIGQASVDFPASSPFATGVGGTSLALNPDNTTGVGTPNGVNFVNAVTQ